MEVKTRKAVIVGSGHVGSHVALTLATRGIIDELVMVDIDEAKMIAQRDDLWAAVSYQPHHVKVKSGDLSDCKDADVVVISVGTIQKSESRLDELKENVTNAVNLVKPIVESGFNGYFLVISNPVDVITYYVRKLSGFAPNKVIGSGTALDSSRLKGMLSQKLGVDQKSITACMMGEHGDSQFAPWSTVNVYGKPIDEYMKDNNIPEFDKEQMDEDVRKAGWIVFRGKGATEFGIASSSSEIISAIFHDEKKVLPASTLLKGQYGQDDVYASVPCVIGKDGIENVIEFDLDEKEQAKFKNSCNVIKEYIDKAKEFVE